MYITCPRCHGDCINRYGEDCQLCNGWGALDPDEPADYTTVGEEQDEY